MANLKLVDLTSDLTNLEEILKRLMEFKDFSPILAKQIVERGKGVEPLSIDCPCNDLEKKIEEIEEKVEQKVEPIETTNLDYDFTKIEGFISNIYEKFTVENIAKNKAIDLLKTYKDALKQIENIMSLDVPLEDIFSCEYVVARVGRLPNDSVEKLEYYRTRPFIFKSFSVDQNYSWCMYFTTKEFEREVDNIFFSLFFERIHIPDFVKGTPENSKEKLEERIKESEKVIDNHQANINALFENNKEQLAIIKGQLLFLNKIYDAKKFVLGFENRFTILGFIEKNNVKAFLNHFDGFKDLEIVVRPPKSDKRVYYLLSINHNLKKLMKQSQWT